MKNSSALVALLTLGSAVFGASLKRRCDEDEGPESRSENESEWLEPHHFGDVGAKRIKMKYGPFMVPGVGDPETMGMKDFGGIAAMPCGDCYITGFLAGLEFPDGTVANANTGMWLHHTVFLNANQSDVTCPDFPQRFLASGNERTPVDLTDDGKYKAGVYLGADDMVVQEPELMNESALEREAYITVEWEYVPADTPGFQKVEMLWLDVTGLCSNTSSVQVADDATDFTAEMEEPWAIDYDAVVVANFGHLHDGGIHQEVMVNGEIVCDHVANYGETEAFITHVGMYGHELDGEEHEHDEMDHEHGEEEEKPGMDHGDGHHHGKRQHDHEEGEQHDHSTGEHFAHISSITYCNGFTLNDGDKLSIKSYYNMSEHHGMAGHHGGLEPVMGITGMFVIPAEGAEAPERPKPEPMDFPMGDDEGEDEDEHEHEHEDEDETEEGDD